MIKKADILLFIAIVIVGSLISFYSLAGGETGETVVVSVDGELYGTYPLDEDLELNVTHDSHTNHITIKDGKVQMSSSNCKNQICVNAGEISETNDKIVCLPNKVVVEIKADETTGKNNVNNEDKGGGYDVISG